MKPVEVGVETLALELPPLPEEVFQDLLALSLIHISEPTRPY